MNRERNSCHVIKDPVHGAMQFTGTEYRWIKPLIDSPGLQRLRHIKQMGMTDYIFPGAVHTRFNHSLGCCYIACQIAHRIGLSDEERQTVMLAGLLHDIGHGPFSHAFEDLFYQRLIRHEDWTPLFLADYSAETRFAEIRDMIMHRSKATPVLADIVSSQLDADRLDYLLRDSHFCGVAYGEFDFPWLLNSMTIVDTPTGERLGITWKGIGAVEHYLMARRLMTRNLCHHPKKLAFEFLLVSLLAELAKQSPDYTLLTELPKTRIGKFLTAVNTFNHAARTTNQHDQLREQFLLNHYDDYRWLCDYDIFALIRELSELDKNNPAVKLAKRIQYRQIPHIISIQLTHNTENEIAQFLQENKNTIEAWQFGVIKTPHQSYTIDEDPILVETAERQVKSLDALSLMIRAISDRAEQTAFLCIDHEIMTHPRLASILHILTKEMPIDHPAGSLT